MKYYELELKNFEENGNELIENGTKTYRLRLTSSNAVALENVAHRSIIDIVGDVSITNIVKVLEYMGKDAEHNFGYKEASSLYDQLCYNGYTMEDVIVDVIYGCLVHSGFLKKEELEEIRKMKTESKNK